MSPNRKCFPQVDVLGSRVLLSAINPFHRKFVDVTGEVMRRDLTLPPKVGPRSVQVYNFQGAGGVGVMGGVNTSGSVTETVRNGSPVYKGNLTLSNNQGSVKITFNSTEYRIKSGTGAYKGASGIGAVSFGTTAGSGLVGLSFTADL